MKVWVLTRVDYDDFVVAGVYSEKKWAEEALPKTAKVMKVMGDPKERFKIEEKVVDADFHWEKE